MRKQFNNVGKSKLFLNKKAVATLTINQAKLIAGGVGFEIAAERTSKEEEESGCTSRPTTSLDTLVTVTDILPF